MRTARTTLVAFSLVAFPAFAQTERVSVATGGAEGDSHSYLAGLSGDGRFVVFASDATNLVADDGNGATDVFVRDRAAGTTERVSVDAAGAGGDGSSSEPAISRDGRFVVFASIATSLVSGDTNGTSDVFLRDRVAASTIRVSTDPVGGQANGACYDPTISADGRFVAFVSGASNLAGPASAQGGVFLKDLATGTTTLIVGGVVPLSTWTRPSVSDGGVFVAATHVDVVSGSTAATLFDRNGMVVPVVASSTGEPGNGPSGGIRLSADGSIAVFHSESTNLVPPGTSPFTSHVYARALVTGVTELLSTGIDGSDGSGPSFNPAVSADGSTVAFESWAPNLVAGDANGAPDVFVRRLAARETVRASVDSNGSESSGAAFDAVISANGRFAAFRSGASDLVPADANGASDVFLRHLGTVRLDSVAPASGSESGGEIANLFGLDFTTRDDTSVTFGGAPARILSIASSLVVVRTPPGIGRVDVEVRSSNGGAALAGAYEYVSPALAARLGGVSVRFGDREDVLFVNASRGDERREMDLAVGAPLEVEMRAPSSLARARFALYARIGAPGPDPVAQPFGLGFTAFPTPLNAGSPRPAVVWNNVIGPGAERLGAPDKPSSPAPTIVARRSGGSSRAVDLTLQGFVRDLGSPNRHDLSATNAVVVRFR